MQQKIICHLIAGFLGSGKTHLIQQLVSYKPVNERWVILVNEVGQQDYPMEQLKAHHVAVKTVLGGCLCCTAGMPFRVALNDMIKQHRPDRIFIEPAGAGHLDNIKTLLQGQFYQPIIRIAATQCLLNNKHLNDPSFAEHENYLQLIEQADALLVYAGEAVIKAKEVAKPYSKPLTVLQGNRQDAHLLIDSY
ncbi:GTP-binding protein [Psychromonas sp. SR45-3]|uniref:GTP-binding protein n=1 Tax=Psychromonas sp. SR45-3 TaxID=2760930 RepID=UPI0015F8E6E0|nr:GTP-binding protein [Psychromonas sp. SR45-3]MBB1273304.1 cobalamin biosynthesis protein [Psychromonas sp. SR45-3]